MVKTHHWLLPFKLRLLPSIMRLSFKMILCLISGILIVMFLDGYVSIQRDIKLFEDSVKQKAKLLGHAMQTIVLDEWVTSGQEGALRLIEDVNTVDNRISIRWVWLDINSENFFSPLLDNKLLGSVKNGEELFVVMKRSESEKKKIYGYFPVKIPGLPMGALELTEDLSKLRAYTADTIKKISFSVALMVLVSLFVIVFLEFFIIGHRLSLLKKKALKIGEGDLTTDVKIWGNDELSDLGNTLNKMCDSLLAARQEAQVDNEARLETLDQLRHADRLKTIGALASGIAHELGTPLNIISGRAGLIVAGDITQEEITKSANIIKNQTERMTSLIKQLLEFARFGSSKKKKTQAKKIVDQIVELMSQFLKKGQIELFLGEIEHSLLVNVDVIKMQQVLMNLISNSMQAMPGGGRLEISVSSETVTTEKNSKIAENKYACFSIRDFGEGIQEDHIFHIFDPFFTTKGSGKGTGLGLSIVQSIVHEHGGWIEVQNKLEKGSCFKVYIPEEENE